MGYSSCFFLFFLLLFPREVIASTDTAQRVPAPVLGSLSEAETILQRIDSLYQLGSYNQALDLSNQLLCMAQQDRNNQLEIKSYQLTGDLLRAIGDYMGALMFLNKVFMFEHESKDTLIQASTYNLISAVFYEYPIMDHLDSARAYALKSIALARLIGNEQLVCSGNIILGSLALNQGDLITADRTLSESLIIAEKNQLRQNIPLIEWHLAVLHEKRGEYRPAERLALKAYARAQSDSIYVYIYMVADFLRQLYLKQGKKELSNFYLSELVQARNRLALERTRRQITNLEASLVIAETEKENQILRTKDMENQRKLQSTLLLTLFLVIVGFIGIAYLINTTRGKRKLEKANAELLSLNRALQEQKKQTENVALELKNTNATLKKFISLMAHDLKNPFNSILGFSELLKTEFEVLSAQEKELAIYNIHNASVHAFTLLEQLLEWGRLQTGNVKTHRERHNLTQLIDEVTLSLDASLSLKKLTLETRVSEALYLSMDVNMVKVVFRNLLSNAIKFTREGGNITLTGIREGDSIVIKISDTGIGISPGHIHKLFFLDGHVSLPGTNNEKGTGLGLILCREYVEQHDGTITVTSIPGKGSTFTVTFPVDD